MKIVKFYFSGLPAWLAVFGVAFTALLKAYQALGQGGATTYFSDNYGVPMPSFPGVGVVLRREFLWTVPVLVVNDIGKLCKIIGSGQPIVLDSFFLDVTDLDSSTGLALSVGDSATPGKFVAIQTAVGQAAGKLTMGSNGVAAALPVSYTTNEDFLVKCTTAPTTGVVGVIKGWLDYHYIGAPTPV